MLQRASREGGEHLMQHQADIGLLNQIINLAIMDIKKTTSGKRFDFEKTEQICYIGWKQDATRGSTLFKTASGNFIVQYWSRWQGEDNTFEECSIENAQGIVLDNMKWEDAIMIFPSLEKDFQEDI